MFDTTGVIFVMPGLPLAFQDSGLSQLRQILLYLGHARVEGDAWHIKAWDAVNDEESGRLEKATVTAQELLSSSTILWWCCSSPPLPYGGGGVVLFKIHGSASLETMLILVLETAT